MFLIGGSKYYPSHVAVRSEQDLKWRNLSFPWCFLCFPQEKTDTVCLFDSELPTLLKICVKSKAFSHRDKHKSKLIAVTKLCVIFIDWRSKCKMLYLFQPFWSHTPWHYPIIQTTGRLVKKTLNPHIISICAPVPFLSGGSSKFQFSNSAQSLPACWFTFHQE